MRVMPCSFAVCALFLVGSVSADRAAIKETLGEMQVAAAAADVSREAKAFQFQLARAFHRRSAEGLALRLDRLAATYDRVFADLDRALDR